MKSIASRFALIVTAVALGACCHAGGAGQQPGAGAGMQKGTSAIYWCGSATDGPCSGISVTRGTCPDGKPMNAGHVLRIEGSVASVCTCGADCSCSIDAKDPAKCGCGKPVRKIDLAGTGIYFCNCGGGCGCNTLADKPGACRCGMPLHQAK